MKAAKQIRGNGRAGTAVDSPAKSKTADVAESSGEQQGTRTRAIAQKLRDVSGAGYLYASLSGFVGEGINPDSYVEYIKQFLDECGAPHDPLEAMLIEQLCLTHHAIGRLFAKSGMAGQVDEATAYAAAAARLAGEFRRSTLALSEYRGRATERLRVVGDDDDTSQRRAAQGAEA